MKYKMIGDKVRRESCEIKDFATDEMIDKEIFRAEQNNITEDISRSVLNKIYKRNSHIGAVFIAFRYGVMYGKRMERAKKVAPVQQEGL